MNLIKTIRSLFKTAWKEEENSIYFHEDLFNQVEFSPRENIFTLNKTNKELSEFSKNHFNGYGFTEIYERENNGIKIIEKQILFNEVDSLLKEKGFKRIDNVFEGYGSNSWKCKNTYAYLFQDAKVFISTKDKLILEFWADGFRFFEDENIKLNLNETLLLIGEKYNLVLNDWDLAITIDLKKESAITKYLNEEIDE